MIKQLIDNISEDAINSFFRRKINGYQINKDELDYIIPDNGYEKFTDLNKLGEWTYENTDELLVFSCKYEGELTARSSKKKQYDLAKKVLKEDFKDGAIFIFYDQTGKFRFSFIRRNYDDASSKYTPFKRYTYFVQPEKHNKTFQKRINNCNFKSLDDIQTAFSVEPLSKQFYKDLSHWYFASLKEVKFPNDRNENEYSLHANAMIRMITRIMFVWFMKQKQLVPDELFDKSKLDELLNYSDSNDSTYYKAILQNLFFATLNTPRNKGRKFVSRQYGVQNFLRYKRFLNNPDQFLELMDSIPFLNGGLFENLDIVKPEEGIEIRIDCFTDPKKNESKLRVPDYLFFGTREVDISEYFESGNYGNVEITGLIDILNRYDFTIDENTPYDQEVALDPELLGLVFENLLASYNPETQSTARKESGSFYTPRPIVDYMVEESLVHYISNDTGLDINHLRQVFSSTDDQPFDQDDDRSKIIKSISGLKIIDPACGSGAFPMGALQKMVFALSKLDPGNILWRKSQKERLMHETFAAFESTDLEDLKKEVDAIFDNQLNDPDYARKLYLIENCLYGVDIQPIAMQISKLRFFISLLVEQHIDREDENFGIIALPNLETKFLAANTLIKIKPPISGKMGQANSMFLKNRFAEEKEKELEKVRHQYFTARTSKTKEKYRKKDKQLREDIANILISDGWNTDEAQKIAQWDPFDPNSKSKWFDCEWMFGIKHFDIVIGNPPYIQLQKALPGHEDMKYADVYKDCHYQTFERSGDVYALFYEKGMDMLHSNGFLCFITSNTWMRANYGKSLRRLFASKNPSQIIELGPGVFESATVDVNVLLIQNNHTSSHSINSVILNSVDNVISLAKDDFILLNDISEENWVIINKDESNIKEKVKSKGTPLQNWNVDIDYGIKTGFNKLFIIDDALKERLIKEDSNSSELIKPIIQGRDIKSYSFQFSNKWLIATFPSLNLNIKNYPGIYKFLNGFKPKLFQTGEFISEDDRKAMRNHASYYGIDLRLKEKEKSRKKTTNNWFETQDQINYYKLFSHDKIMWGELSDKPKFCFDAKGFFLGNTGFILTGHLLKYLVAILNSKLTEWYFHLIGTTSGMGTNRWLKYTIEKLPVHVPDDDIEAKFSSFFDTIHTMKQKSQDTTKEEQQIDLMVYKLYELTFDEVLIVDPDTPIRKKDYDAFSL